MPQDNGLTLTGYHVTYESAEGLSTASFDVTGVAHSGGARECAAMLMHQDDLAVFSNMAHATSTAASTEQQQREGEGDEEDGAEAVPAMGIDATDGEAEV